MSEVTDIHFDYDVNNDGFKFWGSRVKSYEDLPDCRRHAISACVTGIYRTMYFRGDYIGRIERKRLLPR
jgi:hypothetical protein